MKVVSYTLTEDETLNLQTATKLILDSLRKKFADSGEDAEICTALESTWLESAKLLAIFKQLESDGVACIEKKQDTYFTYTTNIIDEFHPSVMLAGFDFEEQLTRTRKDAARCVNEGVWCHTLFVFDEKIDAIGGMIGKDFHGGSFDMGFYAQALNAVHQKKPEYHAQLIDALSQI